MPSTPTFGSSAPGVGAVISHMKQNADYDFGTYGKEAIALLNKFIGPANQGASQDLQQTAALGEKYFQLTSLVHKWGAAMQKQPHEMQSKYREVLGAIMNPTQNASYSGGFDPLSYDFSSKEAPGTVGSHSEMSAKMALAQYILSNVNNPSAQFAQDMVMESTIPIAKQIIPNTVFMKAFPTDTMAPNELSKPYVTKTRYRAFQQGLNSQVAHNYPQEIVTYDPLLVTPQEFERPTVVDMKYIETMNFDTAADIISDGGREIQFMLDSLAFQGLDYLVPNDLTYLTGGAVGGAPIPPGGGTDANGFALDSTGTVMTLDASTLPSVEHLLQAGMQMRGRGYNPDLIITSPYELAVLMSQQSTLLAYANPTSSQQINERGLIGGLVGNALAWTPNLWMNGSQSNYVLWVCDSRELARTVLKTPITVYPKMERRRIEYLIFTCLALFFRNLNACMKIVPNNTQTGLS